MISGSIQQECEKRLTNLYNQHNQWLINEARKVTKNTEEAEDLVAELYEYLHLKANPKIWYKDSYNLFYCNKFLHSRFMNKVKKLNRTTLKENMLDTEEDIPYDTEWDLRMQKAHEDIVNELRTLSATKMWPAAKIFELYWMSDKTLDEVAKDIKISKSTTFLAVKRVRKYLKEVIENPFNV
jgi:RNA polymerase sigma factor (sigma-70 family)